jgi:formate dehydrogenase major subunit
MNTATINSRTVGIRPGETILAAATRLGIEIPTLCHAPGLDSEGGCRLCVVHSENHGHPLAACQTRLAPGMDLQTHHVEVERWRASLLRLHGEAGARTGFRPSRVREGRWTELLERYGIQSQIIEQTAPDRDYSHPLLRFDPGACLSCRLCVTACRDLAGIHVWELDGRGSSSRVTPVAGRHLIDSPCTACGACVDRCPTGALVERHGLHPIEEKPRITDTVCGFCSVGCRIRTKSADGEVIQVTGSTGAAANPGGLLCQRGKFGHISNEIWERLSKPLIRQGAGFREASWDEAFALIERKLVAAISEHGPGAFGAIGSARATTESNYLLQKFCRAVIGSPHIDSPARLSHAPAFAALRKALGLGVGTASFADIDRASCLIVAGADPDASHPVLASRIRRAVADGAMLVVIDPRRTALADRADAHLRTPPGRERAVFQALSSALSSGGEIEGAIPEAARAPAQNGGSAGLPERDFARVVEMLDRHRGATLFLTGVGLTQRGDGTETVAALLDIALLTGNLGRPGAGFLPLGDQNNLQGCLDAGAAPDLLPGHLDIGDPAARARVEDLWGRCLPEERGHTLPEMMAAAGRGDLRALWMMGHDVTRAFSDEALRSLDLFVVQDLFYSDAARHAHVLLPAASAFEQSGVFINAERRAQLVRPSVAPPGTARPDWAVLSVMAKRLGANWHYLDAAQIFAEMALVAPDQFGGITHPRLGENPDGLQWPCPDAGHPGTPTLPVLNPARFSGFDAPEPPAPDPDYPFDLLSGCRIEHNGAGNESRRGPSRDLIDQDRATLHPADAARLGVSSGGRIVIESRCGVTKVATEISDRVPEGAAFLTSHFPQTRLGGLFHTDERDALSDCPASNPLRVRIRPADPGT